MFTTSVASDWFPTSVVFDCDGILLDSESLWRKAQQIVARDLNLTWNDELAEALHGSSTDQVRRVFVEALVGADAPEATKSEQEQIVDTKLRTVAGEIFASGIELIPGAKDVMEQLAAVLPVAVASNSDRETLEFKLSNYGYQQYVTTQVSADDVADPKPAPDMYLKAVQELGGTPERALTFEDSVAGATAAQAAGTVTMILTESEAENRPEGNGYFDSFEDPEFRAQITRWVEAARAAQADGSDG